MTDLEAAEPFHAEACGWQFTRYGPGCSGTRDPRDDAAEVGGLRLRDRVRPGGPLVLVLSADLDASVAAVRAAGGRLGGARGGHAGGGAGGARGAGRVAGRRPG